jgi:hypothetical protein
MRSESESLETPILPFHGCNKKIKIFQTNSPIKHFNFFSFKTAPNN